MQVHNLDSLKHFIKHVMSNTLKLQNLGGGGGSNHIQNPPTNNMLLPHKITINKKLHNKIKILRT